MGAEKEQKNLKWRYKATIAWRKKYFPTWKVKNRRSLGKNRRSHIPVCQTFSTQWNFCVCVHINKIWLVTLKNTKWTNLHITLPPPPRTALIMMGYPMRWASALSFSSDWSSPWYPSMIGTPASDMMCFDVLLIPMSLMAEAGGPTNVMFSRSQASANSTFSDRKP